MEGINMSTKTIIKKSNLFLSVIKGTLVAVSLTLILILAFALLIRLFNINDNWIFPVNQVIKIISLFAGIITMIKGNSEKGFIKGILLGLTYFIISLIVFSILQGSVTFRLSNMYDLLLTTLMGGLIGIILVNVIRKN